jgi:DNA invertase Pin-like site-specific DNA recombinase
MRAAIYCRVSTNEQSSRMQLDELRAHCQRRAWEVVGEYIDEGISGSKKSRPGLDKLLAAAREKSFDTVLVYRYDRFARSLRHLVNALADFEEWGIQFVSLHEGVDTTTPNGRLVFGIFASIAEFERELIRERTRSGMRNAQARGVHCGRRAKSIDIDRVRELRRQGVSCERIASAMGERRATIQRRVAKLRL